jgi:colanic acid/amylovoran biosynthesis glycosyltransferase
VPSEPRLLIVQPHLDARSETFIAAHQRLPGFQVEVVHGNPARFQGSAVLRSSPFSASAAISYADAAWKGLPIFKLNTRFRLGVSYMQVLEQWKPHAVLAEYGPWACNVLEACRTLQIPLIAHFHGYDASHIATIKTCRSYRELFDYAAAIVAVSSAMREQLHKLGASREKVHLIPYGVDSTKFVGAAPALSEKSFLAVGRLVEKKSPLLTLEAFSIAAKRVPDISLTMVGDGPLMAECRRYVTNRGLETKVHMQGFLPHAEVALLMRRSRAFLQHSVVSDDGDSEGMPVAILEAAASGLPVIATRHAGIPEAVLHERTGLLCNEKDVEAMADSIIRIANDAVLAKTLGAAARNHVMHNFDQLVQLEKLAKLIASSIHGHSAISALRVQPKQEVGSL